MLIIRKQPHENGAYPNQIIDSYSEVPEGWVEIPENLIEKTKRLLPFITMTLEEESIINVEDNTEAREAAKANTPSSAIISIETDLLSMTVDHEYRLTLLELGVK